MFSTETILRVRYADTDQMKMVYYAKYFEYFEQGRADLLRAIGIPYPVIEAMGFYLPVIEAYTKYFKPARYDELLTVKTIVREVPAARVRIEYEMYSHEHSELVAEGYSIHSFVNASSGKPTRVPENIIELFQKALTQPSNATDIQPSLR